MTHVVSCEFCEIIKNTICHKTLTTAFGNELIFKLTLMIHLQNSICGSKYYFSLIDLNNVC